MTPPIDSNLPQDSGRLGTTSPLYPSETSSNSRAQWGAILAGAFAGFAVVILMGTLGAALGISAGAAALSATHAATTETAEKAATAFGIGTGIWILLTALATGLVGGGVLNATSRRDLPYSSFVFGGITWAVGVAIMLMIAAPGMGGIASGLGAGAGGAATAATNRPDVKGSMSRDRDGVAMQPGRNEQGQSRSAPALSEEEKAAAKDAADKAAAAAAVAAWVTLAAQLLSIAATIFAAGWHRPGSVRVVTELRPRPAPAM